MFGVMAQVVSTSTLPQLQAVVTRPHQADDPATGRLYSFITEHGDRVTTQPGSFHEGAEQHTDAGACEALPLHLMQLAEQQLQEIQHVSTLLKEAGQAAAGAAANAHHHHQLLLMLDHYLALLDELRAMTHFAAATFASVRSSSCAGAASRALASATAAVATRVSVQCGLLEDAVLEDEGVYAALSIAEHDLLAVDSDEALEQVGGHPAGSARGDRVPSAVVEAWERQEVRGAATLDGEGAPEGSAGPDVLGSGGGGKQHPRPRSWTWSRLAQVLRRRQQLDGCHPETLAPRAQVHPVFAVRAERLAALLELALDEKSSKEMAPRQLFDLKDKRCVPSGGCRLCSA